MRDGIDLFKHEDPRARDQRHRDAADRALGRPTARPFDLRAWETEHREAEQATLKLQRVKPVRQEQHA